MGKLRLDFKKVTWKQRVSGIKNFRIRKLIYFQKHLEAYLVMIGDFDPLVDHSKRNYVNDVKDCQRNLESLILSLKQLTVEEFTEIDFAARMTKENHLDE